MLRGREGSEPLKTNKLFLPLDEIWRPPLAGIHFRTSLRQLDKITYIYISSSIPAFINLLWAQRRLRAPRRNFVTSVRHRRRRARRAANRDDTIRYTRREKIYATFTSSRWSLFSIFAVKSSVSINYIARKIETKILTRRRRGGGGGWLDYSLPITCPEFVSREREKNDELSVR